MCGWLLDVEHGNGELPLGLPGHTAIAIIVDAAGVDDIRLLNKIYDQLSPQRLHLRTGQAAGAETMQRILIDLIDRRPAGAYLVHQGRGLLGTAVGGIFVCPVVGGDTAGDRYVDAIVAHGWFRDGGGVFREGQAFIP